MLVFETPWLIAARVASRPAWCLPFLSRTECWTCSVAFFLRSRIGIRERKNIVALRLRFARFYDDPIPAAAGRVKGHVLAPGNLVHRWNSVRIPFDLRFPKDFPGVLVEGVDITVPI